ncbi:MAG TPA: amino acid ABC transporter permease [Xanthobacteraceae bacterium]|nr:amino acid ABC transporter permease [Xanthobacteraceae bacterium]
MPEVVLKNLPFLLHGLAVTAELALLTIAGGTLIGLVVGVVRFRKVPVLGAAAALYVEIVRGTPLLVMLFITYFAFPALLHYRTTAFAAAVLGFILFIGAYLAEDVRAGLRSVPQGQVDAALALGLTRAQALRFVVVPQALRRMIPALFNQYVRLAKFTSVASVIGVTEFTGAALLVNAREFQPVPILLTVALTYLVLCYGLSSIGRLLYARLAVNA